MRIKKREQGFTLVELMIVVAIVGVLAALAIYGVRKYVLNAKTTEARNSIGQLAKDASTAYNREGMAATVLALGSQTAVVNQLCQSAASPVPAAVPVGKKHQTNPGDWEAGTQFIGWKCLRFSMQDPQYYQYNYTATGTTAVGSLFTAWAKGNLDGDSKNSTFTLTGKIQSDGSGQVVTIAPNIGENYPDE